MPSVFNVSTTTELSDMNFRAAASTHAYAMPVHFSATGTNVLIVGALTSESYRPLLIRILLNRLTVAT